MELYIESQHLHFKPPRWFGTFTLWYTVCIGSSRQTLVWGAPYWYATPSKLTLSAVQWGIIYSFTQQATHHECYWIQIHPQSVRMGIKKSLSPLYQPLPEKSITCLLPLALLLVLQTHNNTDGNKFVIFSSIALYYGDTILTWHYAPFVYKPSPYYLYEFAAEVYLSPIYAPLGLCDSDEWEEG